MVWQVPGWRAPANTRFRVGTAPPRPVIPQARGTPWQPAAKRPRPGFVHPVAGVHSQNQVWAEADDLQDADAFAAQPPAPVTQLTALTTATAEQGMIVVFNASDRRSQVVGWIDNCFPELDEYWVRQKPPGSLAPQGFLAVLPTGEQRVFKAAELFWTGEWSQEVAITETLDIPCTQELATYLDSDTGDLRLRTLEERCAVAIQIDVPCEGQLAAPPASTAVISIFLGPGHPPDIKKAIVMVNEEFEAIQAELRAAAEAEQAAAAEELQKATEEATKQAHDPDAAFKRGYEAALAALAEDDEEDDEEEEETAALDAEDLLMNAEELAEAFNEGKPAPAEKVAAATVAEEEKAEKKEKVTVADWANDQSDFAALPPLPEGWIRIRSQSSGKIYFVNLQSGEQTFVQPKQPLPEGWSEVTSKSTGRTYYWHRATDKSQFDRPT
eukprot:TRINITY_DN101861_c0_g1_i1.p1 TRINITY_DN101861_c0_g1~~TRINITY_DN101861_c0_g1_i1.p1  ORF type:complete len:441 (-),score=109.34 TRINITY_DN101861_c0_g1_i1:62-1384(-)